jgi:hypothetical protein
MSFKPEFQTLNDENYYPNNLAFETKEEAEASAQSTYSKWMLAAGWRVVESDQPVNYKIVDGVMHSVEAAV